MVLVESRAESSALPREGRTVEQDVAERVILVQRASRAVRGGAGRACAPRATPHRLIQLGAVHAQARAQAGDETRVVKEIATDPGLRLQAI